MPPYLVTLGDSVHWGQGLAPAHKLHTIVGGELRKTMPDLVDHFLAHSGAIIGLGATIAPERVDGEVPIAYPTLFQQVDGFAGNPDDVTVVLVNGGINDVDIRRILSPLTPPDHLRDLTWKHCRDGMTALLQTIVARFAAATIVVTPYYPILSYDSEISALRLLLEEHGLSVTPHAMEYSAGRNPIVEGCLRFWRESQAALAAAVQAVGLSRVRFADPVFTEQNAVMATDPLLWGLGLVIGMPPEDEVVDARRAACDVAIPAFDVIRREQCYRASAGHPNVAGARRYADAVVQALGI